MPLSPSPSNGLRLQLQPQAVSLQAAVGKATCTLLLRGGRDRRQEFYRVEDRQSRVREAPVPRDDGGHAARFGSLMQHSILKVGEV